jgi:hypothetical protein
VRQVGGQRQAGGLRGVQPCAHQQEGQPGASLADPLRPLRGLAAAGQHQQREGHDRQPPNCIIVPIQMKGTRRQPSAERWLSERKPMSARSGANSTGSDTITATSAAGTPSSTIITRLRVPTSSTSAMPTDTWNSDSRSSRDSGRSGVAASANGRKRGLRRTSPWISLRFKGFMRASAGLGVCQCLLTHPLYSARHNPSTQETRRCASC